jgi:hypothetical protein
VRLVRPQFLVSILQVYKTKFFAARYALVTCLRRLYEKVSGTIWSPTPFHTLFCPYGLKDRLLAQIAELMVKSPFQLMHPNQALSVIGASNALAQLVFQRLKHVFRQAVRVKVAPTTESDHLFTFFVTNQAFFAFRTTFGLS